MSKRPLALIILDGWGIGANDDSNPIFRANPKTIQRIKSEFPSGSLQASGISVGLAWGEPGNSETGHVILGAGKIIYQYYPKITLAVRDGNFFNNEILKKAFAHARTNNSQIHLIGLLSESTTHAALEHGEALFTMAEKEGLLDRTYLHAISDGRDGKPRSVAALIKKFREDRIASVGGRFYAMDTERHYERIKKYYETITGNGPVAESAASHIERMYKRNVNDDYLEPALIKNKERAIKENDTVIFWNFHGGDMEELLSPFAAANFSAFKANTPKNLFLLTLSQYSKTLKIPAAFTPDEVTESLGKVLAEAGQAQLRIAEVSRYRHVTYFFNGSRDEPFEKEYRVLIPSREEIHPDERPEMQTAEVANRVIEALEERAFDFILANFAAPDAVAHTGNFTASLKAVEAVDAALKKVFDACLAIDARCLITSDHGNIERLFNPQTGVPEADHNTSPVPIYLIAKELRRERSLAEINDGEKMTCGILADVAPTILELLHIPQPKEMTGRSLVKELV